MILEANETNIEKAVLALKEGNCVGMPTETVYGLAADGLNPRAVAQIFEIKKRPSFDPLILHVASDFDLSGIVKSIPLQAKQLMKQFWPGSLTLILPKNICVPDLVTSGLSTVAVRCPDHPVAQTLLKSFGGPLAAPSANFFGRLSPTSAQSVEEELGKKIALTLEGGACRVGVESTILDLTSGLPRILRLGAFAVEKLEEILGEVEVVTGSTIEASGMLDNHYAPRIPLYLCDHLGATADQTFNHIACLHFSQSVTGSNHLSLSLDKELTEAATSLFSSLRQLDQSGASMILAELVPDVGLGRAINDRLFKASAGKARWNGKKWCLEKR